MPFAEEQLESLTREFTEPFVNELYPGESAYFPLVWQYFTKNKLTISGQTKGESGKAIVSRMGLHFSDDSSASLITPFVILIVWETLQEINKDIEPPSQERIENAVRICADALGATPTLRNQVSERLGAKLHLAFCQAVDPHACGPAMSIAVGGDDTIGSDEIMVVDWCDSFATGLNTEVNHDTMNRDSVQDRFWSKRKDYVLYIDECHECVFARKPTTDPWTNRKSPSPKAKEVRWKDIKPRSRKLLGVLLEAFKTGHSISWEEICVACDIKVRRPGGNLGNAISQSKSKLDSTLGGILKECIRGVDDSEVYDIEYVFPYCWIRPRNKRSKLMSS